MRGADNVTPFPGSSRADLPAGNPRAFQPYYPSTMDSRPPPPNWVVDGVAMEGMLCLMTGPPGVGKSLLLQQLLVATALGQPWLGYETQRTRAFGLFCEDPKVMLQRRHWDICEHYGIVPGDLLDTVAWECGVLADNALWISDRYGNGKQTYFWRNFWPKMSDNEFGLVVIDTAAAVFRGNENSRNEVTPFLEAIAAEAARRQITVILSAHPSKGGASDGFSGSTAWLGSVRFAVWVKRPEGAAVADPEREIVGLKANYAAGLRSRRFFFDTGAFRETATPKAQRERAADSWSKLELHARLLDGMRRTLENGGTILADELSTRSLAARARKMPDLARVSLNRLYEAQAEMIRDGRIVRVEVGGRCVIRPDGICYPGEKAWRP